MTEMSESLLRRADAAWREKEQFQMTANVLPHTDQHHFLLNRQAFVEHNTHFGVVADEVKPVTSQKASGRCWIFACLNVLRQGVVQKYNLPEFEFSQSFVFFWDKWERCNFFLEQIMDTFDEPLDGRVMRFLMRLPVSDGGQYAMLIATIEKYGLVPKTAYPESETSCATRRLNRLLNSKLREWALNLRQMQSDGKDAEEIREKKAEMLVEAYRVLVLHLGDPPKKFDWVFADKEQIVHKLRDLTPTQFATEVVEENVADFVSLVHDPRHSFYELLTVDRLGSVMGGNPVLYINVPMEELKKFTLASLRHNKLVWFGCEVGKFHFASMNALQQDLFNYDEAMGVTFGMSKKQRLEAWDSAMTHAMVITGADVHDDGQVLKWRVENSWGDDDSKKLSKYKGYLTMADEWFSDHVYQVAIHKRFLPSDVLDVLCKTPIRLAPWDPLGALAV